MLAEPSEPAHIVILSKRRYIIGETQAREDLRRDHFGTHVVTASGADALIQNL